ncbi:MAG TPA: acetylglutamate kinase [Vicinamibacterales bacterium]|nr:acetylglutamate kinase [Vicinamibacterales bacterium]
MSRRSLGDIGGLVVLKLGGELLDSPSAMREMAGAVSALSITTPLVVVHGGGRAIDAELRARGIEPRFVDGLRITDAPTLDVVVSVLAGRNNTAFVAALHAEGARAVGLTGADAGIGSADRAAIFTSAAGAQVDLGLVGQPCGAQATLLRDLVDLGYVPVVASIGVTGGGDLLNVNADTLAGHVAGELGASRLIIAGGTAGVLDAAGASIDELTLDTVDAMIASGEAHSGMVAKLLACRVALNAGVAEVSIVAGRGIQDFVKAPGTRIRSAGVTA